MKQFFNIILAFAIVISLFSCKNEPKTNGENVNPELKTLDDSIQMLSSQIRENPHNAELFVQRSNLQFINGNLDEAINDMEIAMKVDSTKPAYYTKLASLYMLKDNGSETAKNLLDKCINRYPAFSQAHIDLAKIYLYVAMFQEAMQEIQFLELNNLQNGDSYFTKGMILRKASETESDTSNTNKWKRDALAAFKKAIEYDNENWEAHNLIGVTLTEMGDPVALEYFKAAVSKFPDNQELKYQNGWSLKNFKLYEDAKNTFIATAEMDSASYWTFKAYENLGDMYSELSEEDNKFEIAADYYTKALACDTTNFETYTKRADAYSQSRKYKLAENDYKKALELQTNYEPAINGLNKIAGKR